MRASLDALRRVLPVFFAFEVLRVQSDQLRLKRRQRAEEQAQKAPIKMIMPPVVSREAGKPCSLRA